MIRHALVLSVALAALACNKTETPAEGTPTGTASAVASAPASAAAASAAPAVAAPTYPGTQAGAKQLLTAFLAPGADHAALSKALEPTKADYASVFVGDAAAKAEAGYAPAWAAGAMTLRPKAGQTALLLFSATGAQLAAGSEEAKAFPGGYAKIAAQLNPKLTFYRFKFVEPGKTIGMAFDGLVHVNGHWAIFPKPWRAVR